VGHLDDGFYVGIAAHRNKTVASAPYRAGRGSGSADFDRIVNLDDRFELRAGRGDQARSSTPAQRDKPQSGYDRNRVVLERPAIRIVSRDFH
jgi:hypothetical protein